MYIILIVLTTLLSHHYSYNAAESYKVYDQSLFPFKLGEHQFSEEIDLIHRTGLRRKHLSSIVSLNDISQNERLLLIAQSLYLATQENEEVKKSFAKAIDEFSHHKEAIWEWQQACYAINKTLNQQIKDFMKNNKEMSLTDLQQAHRLSHFAFQQSKYIVEKYICEKTNREHVHRWFIAHNYKGRL